MMPAKPRRTPSRPSDAGRSAIRNQVTATPAEWVEIDALAARLTAPGYPANRSRAVRMAVKAVLDAEADGLAVIDENGIRIRERADRR